MRAPRGCSGCDIAHGVTRNFDIVTFDCYGTLIDWESGISEAFVAAAWSDGFSFSRDEVLRAYAEAEREVERERYRPYREVLTEAAVRTARSLGWNLDAAHAKFLPASLPRWKPFADTNAALERLRASGLKLGILSNVDRDLLAETRRHFTVEFDLIVTAEDVRAYKPAFSHFLAARQWIGEQRWLHAAQSNFHDVVPANAMGIATAWVNRKGQQPLEGGVPTFEVRDLEELVSLISS
jgi:2-haloalkanoic acid dehalogenase type II